MNNFQNFSSWPPEQEASFVPFEQRTVEASKKASTVAMIFAASFLALVLIIVIGFWAPLKAIGEGGGEGDKAEAAEKK